MHDDIILVIRGENKISFDFLHPKIDVPMTNQWLMRNFYKKKQIKTPSERKETIDLINLTADQIHNWSIF